MRLDQNKGTLNSDQIEPGSLLQISKRKKQKLKEKGLLTGFPGSECWVVEKKGNRQGRKITADECDGFILK